MSSELSYNNEIDNYGEQSFTRANRPNAAKRVRPTQGRKRGKSPQSVNGIHKRRRRKMSW